MSNSTAAQAKKDMGARLAAVREALGLTQQALGEFMGVGVTAISSWESGRNKIDLIALARAAATLGFTTDFIAIGDIGGLRFDLARKIQTLSVGVPEGRRRGRPAKQEPARTKSEPVRGAHPDRT